MSEFIFPDWPAPPRVRALVTTRGGGASIGPYAGFNLGDHVGDDPEAVAANRALLRAALPGEPLWLRQVHGTRCVDAASATPGCEADAAFAREPGRVCAVLTADCLPVLLCDDAARVVGAAHAGWRGLAAGVIEATVTAMATPPERLMAWLGPAIGPARFEVGADVRDAFVSQDAATAAAFVAWGAGKYGADLYALARRRLAALGVTRVSGGGRCTAGEPEVFYSYRRDGVSGRMASCIWLQHRA